MSDNLFNAELRDCARDNEIKNQNPPRGIGEVGRLLELSDADFDAWYEGEKATSSDDYGAELDERDLQVAQAEWEAEQLHYEDDGGDFVDVWEDYLWEDTRDDPIDMYHEDGFDFQEYNCYV